MNGLDAAQLALLSSILTVRLHELSTQAAATQGARELAVEEVETSPADKATVRLLNDLALEAAELRDAQLRKIRHALSKIDEGSYGACEECALPVGFSRLQARPEARLCINCQTRAERRQGA